MPIKLYQLIDRFSRGEILLPIMQRDYVWTHRKIAKLLDSLYHRWPIGCFYLWHTRQEHNSRPCFGQTRYRSHYIDGNYGYLLNGQQRLTSLALSIQDPAKSRAPDHCSYFDVVTERFSTAGQNRTVQRRIENHDPTLVPLHELVLLDSQTTPEHHARISEFIEHLKEDSVVSSDDERAEYRNRLDRATRMFDCDVPCEVFETDEVDDAIELFARLNKGGTTLSVSDVEAARLAQEATVTILGPMRDFIQKPELQSLHLNFPFLTRALLAVHRGNASFSREHEIRKANIWATGTRTIEESWEATKQALACTVRLVREDLGWTSWRWLPSTNALIPVVYLLQAKKKNTHRKRPATTASVLVHLGTARIVQRVRRDNAQCLHQSDPQNGG